MYSSCPQRSFLSAGVLFFRVKSLRVRVTFVVMVMMVMVVAMTVPN